jgi:TPR repeat protein
MIWFKSAAQNGDARSQHNLAIFYLEGAYLTQDIPNAYAWSILAYAKGFPASRKRAETEHPTADLAAAQARADQLMQR